MVAGSPLERIVLAERNNEDIMDKLRLFLVAAFLLMCPSAFAQFGNPAITYPGSGAQTITATSTISVTSTFQSALSALASRKACLIQNTGTHIEYVYFGAIASATTSNSFQISPGQTISCATQTGIVLTDAVSITGTAGDGYIVASQ